MQNFGIIGPNDDLKTLLRGLTKDVLEAIASYIVNTHKHDERLGTILFATHNDIEQLLDYINRLSRREAEELTKYVVTYLRAHPLINQP